MEKLSRVKKYEDLRKSIETDNPVDKKEEEALQSESTLRQFDSSVFKKVDITEEAYQPEREKVIEEKEAAKPVTNEASSFTNEYLDDFIQEVREYNIRKGTREYEDTQVDILAQLNAVNRAKRSQYVEPIPNEEPLINQQISALTKEDIALEVANLLRDDEPEELPEEAVMEASVAEPIIVEQPKKQILIPEPIEEEEEAPAKKRGFFKRKDKDEEEEEAETVMPQKKEAIDPVMHKKLLEETQQLRVQMDEYEDELTDLSNGVEKTNKLLNFVLCFLILVLLVIIGFIVYSLLKAGGKI